MTIYVKSVTSHGDCAIFEFRDKNDLARFANEKDIWVKSNMNIENILDELYYTHIIPSTGSVTHWRITRKDAIQAIRDGAKNETFLDVKRKEI